jgi:hypothetical protein
MGQLLCQTTQKQLVLSSRVGLQMDINISNDNLQVEPKKPIFTLFEGCTSSKLGGLQCKVHIHDFKKIQIPTNLNFKIK